MDGPFPAGVHPRDAVEGLAWVLAEIARRDPAPLIAVLTRDAAAPDPQLWLVASALGSATGRAVVEALALATRHGNPQVRYGAVTSLIRLRTAGTVEAVLRAIRDRSDLVRHVAVDAVARLKRYRVPAAAPHLRRLLASEAYTVRSPGTAALARRALADLAASTGSPEPT
jgi:HEAT repeat protein